MSDQNSETKEGGARFPFINLEKAIGRAKELFDADQRGREMTIAGVFGVWEYSEKSSGGFQTIAALKQYGLIQNTNSGDGRKVRLSDSALRYFRDEREEEKKKLAREFALKPKIVASLWKDWHVTPPGDTIARSHLKAERGLTDQASRSLLSIYKENLAFADLTGDDKIPEVDGDAVPPPPYANHIKVGDYVQWTSGGIDQFKAPRKVVGIFPDGLHVQVFGSNSGIPMHDLTVVEPPPPRHPAGSIPPPHVDAGSGWGQGQNDFNVLQAGGRLQITADVDLEGLQELKAMLNDYESILTRIAARKLK
jgi:hypothetical protein